MVLMGSGPGSSVSKGAALAGAAFLERRLRDLLVDRGEQPVEVGERLGRGYDLQRVEVFAQLLDVRRAEDHARDTRLPERLWIVRSWSYWIGSNSKSRNTAS